jgi:hypothetical protein
MTPELSRLLPPPDPALERMEDHFHDELCDEFDYDC